MAGGTLAHGASAGRLALPNIRAQDSIREVLDDVKEGKTGSEEFWVEIDGKEVRFRATKESKLFSDLQPYTAIETQSAMQLDLYHQDHQVGLLRFGSIRAQLPKGLGRTTCGDVSGSRFIVGDDNGGVHIMDPSNLGEDLINLEGHLLHTSIARFFPSGEVALSAGMDFSMKLWDIASGSMIQKLVLQKGMIDEVALIGRGRNLLSLCRATQDVVLWEVGKPQVVHQYAIPGAASLCLWKNGGDSSNDPHDEVLYEANGKVGVVGTDKSLLCLDLRSPDANRVLLETPADKIDISNNMLLYSHGKEVTATDMRMPQSSLFSLTSPEGDITEVIASPSKLYMSTESTLYGFETSSSTSEVLCSESEGVTVAHENELWHIGYRNIRHFPL